MASQVGEILLHCGGDMLAECFIALFRHGRHYNSARFFRYGSAEFVTYIAQYLAVSSAGFPIEKRH